MKGKILFSINTVFHLMLTKIIIQKYNLRSCNIVCFALNPEIEKIIINDGLFENNLIINRDREYINRIEKVLKTRKSYVNLRKFLKSITIDCVVVFKDNDNINQIILEYAKKKRIKTILIEEGLGIYINPSEGYIESSISKLKRILFSYPKYSYNAQGINPLIDEIIVNCPKMLPSFKQQNKVVKKNNLNKIDKTEIQKLFDYFNTQKSCIDFEHQKGKKTVLYIGQPFSEFELLDQTIEQRKIKKIFQTFKKLAINVLIKPHPSEKVDKYKEYIDKKSIYIILETHIPVELLPVRYNIDLAITAYSSSSFYLNKWYGIKTLSLSNYFVTTYDQRNSVLKELYETEIIDDVNDLEQKINGIGK